MKLTKTLSFAGIGAAIVTGSLLAVTAASAHSPLRDDTIASEIATRFNLDQNEVQTFFDEKRQEHEVEMEQKHAEHLASLVENGTLTQEQADALQAKQQELHDKRDALQEQGLTRDEIRDQMDALRDEFEGWAEEQGIDLEAIRPEGMGGRHGHRD